MLNFGLNLFSLRTLIDSEKKFIDTAIKLKEMGYDSLQYSGTAFDTKLAKKVTEESQLKFVLTHVPMDRILNDTDRLIDEHLSINCKNIGLGMMPIEIISNSDKCKDMILQLDAAAKKISDRGCKFFYHNHHYEFIKYENKKTCFDYLIELGYYINFTFDTYWAHYSGVDIVEFLNRVKNRVGCVHLKDYKLIKNQKGEFVPNYAAIGDGNLNFSKIINKMKDVGTKYFIVEQDDAFHYNEPLLEVKKSINYLRRNYNG